ncbi:peroxiredoxin-like family protein [Apibacter raozihei]|uniref:peroxiredoxin-like family protein n=1 Tax=Apibacter raozihei TaxID=2500547 RepID=UPI000FE326A5|nr:peroxiredoxin-like family protein [Apibacter raozihei]
MSKLKKQLEKLNAELVKQLPKEIQNAFQRSILDLKEKSLEWKFLKKGKKIPFFNLDSTLGKPINSNKIFKEYDKLILVFFRGSWCPYCNLELKALDELIPLIKNKNSLLLGISPQNINQSLDIQKKLQLSFDILIDKGNVYASLLGISFSVQDFVIPYYNQLGIYFSDYNEHSCNLLPIPAVFIINKNHEIIYSYVNPDYTERINPEDILLNL